MVKVINYFAVITSLYYTLVFAENACQVFSGCRIYSLSAWRIVSPDLNAISGFQASPPLSFQIPPFLNVTRGNAANEYSYIQIIAPSGMIFKCTYRGPGKNGPSMPIDPTATAYIFQSCDSNGVIPQGNINLNNPGSSTPPIFGTILDLVAGSMVTATQVTVYVNGLCTSGGLSQARVQLNLTEISIEDGGTITCLKEEPSGWVNVQNSTLGRGQAQLGTWSQPPLTTVCVDTATSTTFQETPTELPMTTFPLQSPVETSTTPVVPNEDASETPIAPEVKASEESNIIIIAAGVGGAFLLVSVGSILIWRRNRRGRRNSAFYGDFNNRGKKFRGDLESVHVSGDTIRVVYDEFGNPVSLSSGDFDAVFGNSREEDGEQAEQENETSAVADRTLMNTRAAIALPGFLKMDYLSDVRPNTTLAEGGGGIVYQADLLDERLKQKHNTTTCVVKLLKNPGTWSHEEMQDNFRQEVSIMWSLCFSEHVIKLIGYTEEPMSIITRQYKTNLSDLLRDPKSHPVINIETQLRFCYHIASAMKEIHGLGIIHRDMKSSNLLLDIPEGSPVLFWKVVVCDFGLAKIVGEVCVKGIKQVQVNGISYRYAAPEVFQQMHMTNLRRGTQDASAGQKSSSSIDPELEKKVDVFAFALILWELVNKKIPWSGMSNEDIEWNVRNGHRPMISAELRTEATTTPMLQAMIGCIEAAWQQELSSRPSFLDIEALLRDLYETLPQPSQTEIMRLYGIDRRTSSIAGHPMSLSHSNLRDSRNSVSYFSAGANSTTMSRVHTRHGTAATSASNMNHARYGTFGQPTSLGKSLGKRLSVAVEEMEPTSNASSRRSTVHQSQLQHVRVKTNPEGGNEEKKRKRVSTWFQREKQSKMSKNERASMSAFFERPVSVSSPSVSQSNTSDQNQTVL